MYTRKEHRPLNITSISSIVTCSNGEYNVCELAITLSNISEIAAALFVATLSCLVADSSNRRADDKISKRLTDIAALKYGLLVGFFESIETTGSWLDLSTDDKSSKPINAFISIVSVSL